MILLGYTFRHQLVIYSCFTCLFLHAYSCYCYSVHLLCYLVIHVCSYLVIILCTLFIYTSSPLYTHTHSSGRFLMTLDLRVQILDALFLLFRCSLRPYASRRAGASSYLIPVFSSLLYFCYFFILDISDSFVILVLDLYDIMRGCLYVILH